jgi:hypothetical protein
VVRPYQPLASALRCTAAQRTTLPGKLPLAGLGTTPAPTSHIGTGAKARRTKAAVGNIMSRLISRASAAIVVASLASTACAVNPQVADPDANEDAILRRTGRTSSWSYKGLMPTLDAPTLTVSLTGHTVHVAGLLPIAYTGPLPFYAIAETARTAEGRTRVHLVYPIATVGEGTTPEGLITRNPEPYVYKVCGGDNAHASNDIGSFGGFPFIQYVCGHKDAVDKDNTRIRSGIAFHGPITSMGSESSEYWYLKRGPVSHACNRMLGEHVLELAHLIGFDKNVKVAPPVRVIQEFDTFRGKKIDVDYPATGWSRPDATEAFVFPLWQAVLQRPDGGIEIQFPQWACETSRCDKMPPNAYDAFTGKPLPK